MIRGSWLHIWLILFDAWRRNILFFWELPKIWELFRYYDLQFPKSGGIIAIRR